MKNDYSKSLENLRAAIKEAVREGLRPPPDYLALRRALRTARFALISDEAFDAACKASDAAAWREYQDRAVRAVASCAGIELP